MSGSKHKGLHSVHIAIAAFYRKTVLCSDIGQPCTVLAQTFPQAKVSSKRPELDMWDPSNVKRLPSESQQGACLLNANCVILSIVPVMHLEQELGQ